MSATSPVLAPDIEPGFQVRLRRKRVNVERVETIYLVVNGKRRPVYRVWYKLPNGVASHFIDLRATDTVLRYEHAITA